MCTDPEPTCPGKDKGQCDDFPRNPYKCGADSCVYGNVCLVKDAGFDIDADCCQAPDPGACLSIYDPVFCGGGDNVCPYSNLCLAELAGYSEKQCSSVSDPGVVCPADVLECPGGETLNRDPENDCQFPSCPCDSIADCRDCLDEKCAWVPGVNGKEGGCAKNCNKVPADVPCFFHKFGDDADTCPADMCPADILVCPGGETLNRDPNNNCKFPSCPCDTIGSCADCLEEKCAWVPGVNGKEGGCAKNCNKVPADASCFFHKFGDDADTCPVDSIVWEQAAPALASRRDGDYFGSNNQLDATGTRFLVSAKKSSGASGLKEAGMVKVYDVRSNGSMRQVGQTLYGFRDGDEVQGVLAKSGKRLVMFTPNRDGNAGRVWIYELRSGNWVEIGKIERPKNSGERFGSAVAVSRGGGIIVVGSSFANNKKGKVSVFQYAGGTVWNQLGSDILGNFVGGKFGWSIDIASDASTPTFVVGEKSDDAGDNSGRPGQAQIYRWNRSNAKWRLVGNPIRGQNPGDSFGRDVAISSDGLTIVSGARFYGNKDKGGAFGFNYLGGGAWISQGGIVGDSAGDELFIVAMNAAGDRIAVGSGSGLGYVKVFDYGPSISGAGAWTQIGETLRGKAYGENFGSDISMSADGETLLVGSPSRDNLNQPGSVRLYKLTRKAQGGYPKYPHISPTIQSAGDESTGDDYSLGISSISDKGTRDINTTSPGATMKASFAFSIVIIFTTALL